MGSTHYYSLLLLLLLLTTHYSLGNKINERLKDPEVRNKLKQEAKKAAVGGAGKGLNKLYKDMGAQVETSVEERVLSVSTKTEMDGFEHMNACAGAGLAKADASAFANPTLAKAEAGARGPHAETKAALIDGVFEAKASADAAKVGAKATVGHENLGAYAKAEAVAGKVEAGITHTPFQVSAQGPSAHAETGASWDYTGVNVGASLGEARAGPFAVRAGLKFGVGVRNGVAEVDIGPVTVPTGLFILPPMLGP